MDPEHPDPCSTFRGDIQTANLGDRPRLESLPHLQGLGKVELTEVDAAVNLDNDLLEGRATATFGNEVPK